MTAVDLADLNSRVSGVYVGGSLELLIDGIPAGSFEWDTLRPGFRCTVRPEASWPIRQYPALEVCESLQGLIPAFRLAFVELPSVRDSIGFNRVEGVLLGCRHDVSVAVFLTPNVQDWHGAMPIFELIDALVTELASTGDLRGVHDPLSRSYLINDARA
jgi:hypothetical protein